MVLSRKQQIENDDRRTSSVHTAEFLEFSFMELKLRRNLRLTVSHKETFLWIKPSEFRVDLFIIFIVSSMMRLLYIPVYIRKY